METIKIALPESMKTFVQKRAAEGNFSSVREYVLDLIRADHQRRHEEPPRRAAARRTRLGRAH